MLDPKPTTGPDLFVSIEREREREKGREREREREKRRKRKGERERGVSEGSFVLLFLSNSYPFQTGRFVRKSKTCAIFLLTTCLICGEFQLDDRNILGMCFY